MQKKNDERVRIVKLEEIDVSVDEILDEFIQIAEGQLGGDLKKMLEPLKKAIREKKVGGLVAYSDQPLGMVVYAQRGGNGRVNFIHVLSSYQDEELFTMLITRAVTELKKGGVTRIVSEPFVAGDDKPVRKTFEELGFCVLERMVMSRTLAEKLPEPVVPPEYELVEWDDKYVGEVSEVIHDANLAGVDQLIYPEFKTVEGTSRMVQGVRGGAAGPFNEKASVLAFSGSFLSGVILFTQHSPEEGFIAEMAVARAHQGKGVGKALLTKSLSIAREQGAKAVTLGVTKENVPAVKLYCSLGFTAKQQLSAYIWED